MIFKEYLSTFLSYMLFIPSVITCFLPAKNHLRLSGRRTITITVVFSLVISVFMSVIAETFSLDPSYLSLPVIIIMFIMYHLCTDMHISQSLGVYLLSCNCATIFSNYSIIYDALTHPDNTLADFSLSAGILLFVTFTLFCIICFHPLSKYGSYLVDNLSQSRVWWTYDLIALLFYGLNVSLIIHKYSTLQLNSIARAYITLMIMMFALMVLFCVIFYFVVNALVEKARAEDENHILKMQEKQYTSLQRYIDSDAKARHDFRQTIYALTELSEEKNYSAIDEYLHRYRETLPEKETTDFCSDQVLNALLNHYMQQFKTNEIRTDLRVMLPETNYIDSIDLCSIVGNILENAITACLDIPEESRFIRMVISEEQNRELYIAISNSYSGLLKKKGDRYLSTHKGGNGIGLISIAATAARYGGTASFSHDENVFYSDVVLVNKPDLSESKGTITF